MPPAPTSPSTTEERTAFSSANSAVSIIDGSVLGTTAPSRIAPHGAPSASSAR